MKATDRAVLVGLAIAGLLGAFWFMVLSPKREDAGELQDRIVELEASVAEQEEIVASAEQARASFDTNYQDLVVLGKAVPEDEDTASLFVQLEQLAGDANVDFEAISLASGGGEAPTTGPEQTTADGSESESEEGDDAASEEESEEPAETTTVAVPATEPSVAGLPLGATVGPAGLPVMPYSINLKGDFFELADFLHGVDSLVRPEDGKPRVRGRLVTVDGFSLAADDEVGFPELSAQLAVTTFVTPAEQGLTGGASPAGPAPTDPATTTTVAPAP